MTVPSGRVTRVGAPSSAQLVVTPLATELAALCAALEARVAASLTAFDAVSAASLTVRPVCIERNTSQPSSRAPTIAAGTAQREPPSAPARDSTALTLRLAVSLAAVVALRANPAG